MRSLSKFARWTEKSRPFRNARPGPASFQPFDMFQSIELDGFAELDRGQMEVGTKAARSRTVAIIPQSPSPGGKRASFHPPPASKIAHLGPRKASEMASPSVTRDVR